MNTANVRTIMDEGPMRPLQVLVVALCFALNFFDGFDILAISFTAPAIRDEWGLSPETLGMLLSSSLAGMMLGSFLLAPLADRFGRRPAIIGFLALASVGMLMTGLVGTVYQAMAARFVTGLAIGGILPSMNALVAEYSNARRRAFSINVMHTGYTVGAVVGGILAIFLIQEVGWRAVYFAGGAGSLLLLIVVVFTLPESTRFLAMGGGPDRQDRLRAILRRLGVPEDAATAGETDEPASSTVATGVRELLSPRFLVTTLVMWTAFFVVYMVIYYLFSWLPASLTATGVELAAGVSATIFVSVGGTFGMLAIGYYSPRFGLVRLLKLALVLSAPAIILVGLLGSSFLGIALASMAAGAFLSGSIGGLYALAARVYPTSCRSTATGWAIGVGRFGAILGPVFAGYLYGADWTNVMVMTAFAVVPFVALAALILGQRQGESARGFAE